MQKFIIASILFLSLLPVACAKADNSLLRDDTPDRHVVAPGDTLWGIASRFLKDPWRWPEIWGFNREQIKNPHKIYPGDIIVLERTTYGSRLRIVDDNDNDTLKTVKLSPRIRSEQSSLAAIPSIPSAAIEPFLSQPLIIEKNELDTAPYIVSSSEGRYVLSTGNKAYVSGLPEDQGMTWQVFRPGKALKDPDNKNHIIGFEAVYLGNAKVDAFDKISTLTITRTMEEILKGDRLKSAPENVFNNYVPHAPDFSINGRIISVYGGITEIGHGHIVTLNKGKHDGLEMGHVLAVYRRSQAKLLDGKTVQLPDERTGLVFVFRVFDHVAYALVVQSTSPMKVLDAIRTP